MELLQMSAFVSLAQTMHMSHTAQELNTSQSHVSKLISSLEAELGVKLFDRVGRGIKLNEHGLIFYEYAAEALALMNNGQMALKSVRDTVLGTVRIGSYAFTSILHPCIRAFVEQNPYVNFYFTEAQQPDANTLMNTTDLVLAAAKDETYILQSYFPVSRELLTERFYLVLSPKLVQYPKGKNSMQFEEVKDYPMVEVSPSPYYQNWVFKEKDVEQILNQKGFKFRIGYTVNDFFTKVSLVDQGVGFALFPEICISSALRIAPDLQVFTIEDFPIQRRILVARKHRTQMSPAARAFWDFILQYYNLQTD